MAWLILLGSAVLEAVWATALGESQGFTRLWPSLVFAVAVVVSMLGLGRAMKDIPIGTAYAVWTGVGAALTVTWAMVTGSESVSVMKIVFLGGIILAVVGLQLAPDGRSAAAADGSAARD
ncbi:multidrug efflux SMR transporter [Tessaracoccus sp. SD287]|uniref:DMT family transporter n=1 Tax=Tessaracoccus sp. SD287 TaxID=2782008 RepID=UPI001A966085|nr:multidrug efflux SMR transporter [Tessaracoccus sp. SD287]MBO1031369.1 multidrug efflux SMR transporter [Tessaracoccus sp. SD287]